MSETRAHFELKEVEYLNESLFVENQLRQMHKFFKFGTAYAPKTECRVTNIPPR